jgi:hypothetical protein
MFLGCLHWDCKFKLYSGQQYSVLWDEDHVLEELTACTVRTPGNVGQYLPYYMAQHPRRKPSSYSLP